MRMSYRRYKQHYSDCKAHDYNASDKTIEVDIPYGRMKDSGVRGKKYDTFTFKATDGENVGTIEYKGMTIFSKIGTTSVISGSACTISKKRQ